MLATALNAAEFETAQDAQLMVPPHLADEAAKLVAEARAAEVPEGEWWADDYDEDATP